MDAEGRGVLTVLALLIAAVGHVVIRARQVAALLVGTGLVALVASSGMPLVDGLLVVAVGALGAAFVGLAVLLPVLPRPPAR